MELAGSIALVTGAARRIGRQIALELGRRGARVAIHYRSSEAEARQTREAVSAFGVDAAVFRADLASPSEPTALVAAVEEHFGGLDILVNSASVFGPSRWDDTTAETWDTQLNVNARAPFLISQAAARVMQRSGRGKIINIADGAGESVWPGYLAYSISKATLLAVTKGMARSLAPEITVAAVAPGPVLFPENYSEDQKKAAVERTLLKRAGSAEDVMRAVLFLLENDYITGDVIHVDGGRHLV
jgi:NAD(P)-dependent dehydrogenase (short-subunit alcohol dehydrogenase family)